MSHAAIRSDDEGSFVTSDPNVMMGKPVIAGTRITVESILERLGAGETAEQILESHPRLTIDGLRSALAYAAKVLRSDDLELLDLGRR